MAAIDLITREPERREKLWENCRRMIKGLRALGFAAASSSAIVPVIIGDAGKCMRLSEGLLERGIFAQGIRPPTVPPGTSRLRITLMASHTDGQIDRMLRTLEEVKALS
ncbi:MAG TPA: aminotransferase class I/II-fold pyridoxal phosphate-dependent enzyme, partial [Candidatus Binatia bacterium]|nr:aminotransferase class I/II-fold pyridoxal phosphate-dependent enzyme [Candidatus Binatia bacterium]